MIDKLTPQPKTDTNTTFAEKSAQYPFLKKLFDLSQLSIQKGKVLPTKGTISPNSFISVFSSSPDPTAGFSVENHFNQDSATIKIIPQPDNLQSQELAKKINQGPHTMLPTITLYKNGPPKNGDQYASRSTEMSLIIRNDGQVTRLTTQESYWHQLMEDTRLPLNSIPNEGDHILINHPVDISQLDPKIIEFISKSIDLAYQNFNPNNTQLNEHPQQP
jgi:hypothetical protein